MNGQTKINRMRKRAVRALPKPDPGEVLRQYGESFAVAGKALGDSLRKIGESLQFDPVRSRALYESDAAAAHVQRRAEIEESMDAYDRQVERDFGDGYELEDSPKGAQTIADVGDMIKVLGKWHGPVLRLVDGVPLTDDSHGSIHALHSWNPEAITEVYTKAEQEANGALVHFLNPNHVEWGPAARAAYDDLGGRGLTEFIDHGLRDEDAWILTHEAVGAMGEFRPAPTKIVVGHPVGPQIHEDTHDEPKDQPTPEWHSWDLITAGDDRPYRPHVSVVTGVRTWWPLDGSEESKSDDEIAELGPVRRAVVVTLPDLGSSRNDWLTDNGDVYVATFNGDEEMPPETVRIYAAELLAAAIKAEARS